MSRPTNGQTFEVAQAIADFRSGQEGLRGIEKFQRALNRLLPIPNFSFPIEVTLLGLGASETLPPRWNALFQNHPQVGSPRKVVECIVLLRGLAEIHRLIPDLEAALESKRRKLLRAVDTLKEFLASEDWTTPLGNQPIALRLENEVSKAQSGLDFLTRYIRTTNTISGSFCKLALPKKGGRENVALNFACLMCEQLKDAINLPQYDFVQAVCEAIFPRRRIPSAEDIRKAYSGSARLTRPALPPEAAAWAEDFMRSA